MHNVEEVRTAFEARFPDITFAYEDLGEGNIIVRASGPDDVAKKQSVGVLNYHDVDLSLRTLASNWAA